MRSSESNDCNGNVRALERRDMLLRWAKRLACLGVTAAIALGSFHAYLSWRKQHLEKQVAGFVARGEFQSATLVARRLFDLDENNLAAAAAMAELAEKLGRPEAVVWRKRLAHQQPADISAQLTLARTALRFGQQDLAEHVLDALPAATRGTVAYHEIAGAAAMNAKRNEEAEAHFAAAAELEPANPQLAANLALLRLASPDQQRAAQARAQVAQLADTPAVRLQALRGLTSDAIAHAQRADAVKWAKQLRGESGVTLGNALLCLRALEGTPEAAPLLKEVQTKAAPFPDAAAELITWLNRNGMAVVAAQWSKELPDKTRQTQPVPLATAESYSFLEEWDTMHAFVDGQDWGAYEAFRLAVESHALRRLGPSDRPSLEAQTAWANALNAAKRQPGQLAAIAQLAEGWGYLDLAEEAWWLVASGNENPKPGLSALQRLYKISQNTRGLLRVAKRATELNPSDLVAANNCASIGLLLSGDSSARRLAQKLHVEHPENVAFATTYAFGLQTEGKLAEALKLMETLKEDQLRLPPIAAYYVVMLVENGNLQRARQFLAAAQRANLLPEEQQLLSAATRKLLLSDTSAAEKTVANRTTR